LRSRQPAVALTVVDDHMQRRLADGELDLAVVNEHPVLPETASTALGRAYLFDDAFQVVLPRRHRLARSGTGLDLPDGRLRPRVARSSDDYRAVQAFVAAGLGVAVIPGLAIARAARRAPR
jgi:DNA-binding transcriptional LysR family regulator